jgi:hypothetical protein
MFDIPDNGKDIVISYLNDKFSKKGKSSLQLEAKPSVLDNLRKKTQFKSLLLSKSLIVKL